ncbi:MAG: glycoside hydrolase family 127 protein [Vicinamibacteraceae bacterium]|nr:glycoside hydrolase family 127 protein [Vicinamibacteraceae bacterium]
MILTPQWAARLGLLGAGLVGFLVSAGSPLAQAPAPRPPRDYPVQPVPFTSVHLDDHFWRPRIDINREDTIPFAFQMCEQTGRVNNFIRAARVLRGEKLEDTKPPGYPFDDSDVFKVIEGASYALSVHPDPKLDAYLDDLIAKIGAAQEKDGYLYTTRTIDPKHPHPWAGPERWVLEKDDSHELYNLGHLYEAAVAHYQATGKRSLLDIALRTADLLTETFGPGKKAIWPGHQNTEMGLVKLYRVTGEPRYLELAKFMLDVRGPDGDKGAGREYNQSHQKVIEQTEAVGHAVRATYMYSGMADVAALTGDTSYLAASDRIWENVAGTKLYITGGIGATGRGEAFGGPYELPNMTAYNETCAAIGNDYWNHRLFLLHADAKYIDVMERTLFNGLISGVALDGKTFFYPNPLESNGQHERSPWFGVACCPGNVTRFLASVPGYLYATEGDTLYVNLFAQGSADITLGSGRKVKVAQQTRYPWEGDVRLTVTPESEGRFAMKIRIPGWARNEPVPSDLYRFLDTHDAPPALSVNGEPVTVALEKGYTTIERTWKAGDVVMLQLPMPVRRLVAHPKVEADRDRVAFQRGPIVFALEWPDNHGERVRNLVLASDPRLETTFRADLLNGVQVVTGDALSLAYDAKGAVTKTPVRFTAIPYHAWANRGRGQMVVWMPTRESLARPAPFPTLATRATVTASGGRAPNMVNDGEQPQASDDNASAFVFAPPREGGPWIEYAFDAPTTVSEVSVYWFAERERGRVKLPASWRLLYKDGEVWKPVEATEFGVAADRFNRTTFTPVTTRGLRIEVTPQPQATAGINEWKVRE